MGHSRDLLHRNAVAMRRGFMNRVSLSAGFFVLLPHAGNSAAIEPDDGKALTVVTQSLCHSQVAMLAESATHGANLTALCVSDSLL